MKPELIKEMQHALEQERNRLRAELAEFTNKDTTIPGDFDTKMPEYGTDEDDNAKEVETYERDLSLEHTLEKQLFEIEDALKRIVEGTYGICEDCHIEIPEERLRALPSARYCLDCSKKHA